MRRSGQRNDPLMTQRAKDAQDPEDLLEVVRQRDALQQEVALCQSIANIRAFHDVTDEFYQRELQETLPRLETLDTQSLSMAIVESPYAAAVDETFGPQLRRLLTLDQRLHTGGKELQARCFGTDLFQFFRRIFLCQF